MKTRLALLAACIALCLLPSYRPIYDGVPHSGDESMSLAQAMNCFRQRSPGYGYTADGDPWNAGPVMLPGFFVVYGPAMALTPPFKRIAVARAISRVLIGAGLFLGLLLIGGARRWRPDRRRLDETGVAIAAVSTAALFAGAEPFMFAGSFGRIDALGLFAVCAYQLGAAWFLEARTGRRLLVLALLALLALSCNFLAGSVCGADAIVIGAFHLARPFTWRKLRDSAVAVGVVLVVAVVSFLLVNVVWLHVSRASTPNNALSHETAAVMARLTHVGDAWFHILRIYPGLLVCLLIALAAAIAGLASRERHAPYVLLLARLAVLWLVARTFFVAERYTYEPMLIAASLFPLLDVVVRQAGRRALLSVAVATALLATGGLIKRHPGLLSRHVGFNEYRDAHLRSVSRFLDGEQAQGAIADDPLFTLLDGSRHFYFIYENDVTPEREYGTLVRFINRFHVRYLVSTEFGRRGWLEPLGFPHLKEALVEGQQLVEPLVIDYPNGHAIRATRVHLSSGAPVELPGYQQYHYGDRNSTPFTTYRLEVIR